MAKTRAFLSHSSSDKEVLEATLEHLTASGVIYDAYEFNSGEILTAEIVRAISEAGIFVLLASRSALSSKFVNLEIEQARFMMQSGILDKILVLLIDEDLNHRDLPDWLQGRHSPHATNPEQVLIEIETFQSRLITDNLQQFFVNRVEEQQRAQRSFAPSPPERRPQTYITYGPPGMGRRTLSKRVMKDFLGSSAFKEFSIESGDSPQDLLIKLAAVSEPYRSASDFRALQVEFHSLSELEITDRIKEALATLVSRKYSALFVDDGGIVANNGELTSAGSLILGLLQDIVGMRSAFILRRKPQFTNYAFDVLPLEKLKSLSAADMKSLLQLFFSGSRIHVTSNHLDDLAEACYGFPPAARQFLTLIESHGVEYVLRRRTALYGKRKYSIADDLKNDDLLNVVQQRILVALAFYSPLPLTVLAESVEISNDELDVMIEYLIDMAYIYPDDYNRFMLSEALINDVANAFDGIEPNFQRIYTGLYSLLRSGREVADRLPLERVMFRAHTAANQFVLFDDHDFVVLANDFIRSCIEAYRAGRYAESLEMARISLSTRDNKF